MPTQFYPMSHDDAVNLIAAINAFAPGLVTTSQRGFLAPDAEAIENGFIKLATSANKGLLSKTFAALLESPDKIIFYANSVTGSAGFHNSIYRGKYLGTSVTAAQYAAISASTFDDMFIGDYWTINGVNWRIAAFDYWLNCGDMNTTAHHVVLVPDSALHSAKMNNSNVTTGGYVGSDFYTGANSNTGKSDAITKVNAAFGAAHILSHRELFTNAVTDGKASGWAWYDSTVDLMNEVMVYGTHAWSSAPSYETGIDKSQLPLFALEPSRICNRGNWWLRSVYSATLFAIVYSVGDAYGSYAGASYGIRPAFAIKA